MEIRHLRYFIALTEELNFTKAAEKLRITQSTLSHQIRQLEQELGVTLFERTLKKVEVTYAGEQLLGAALRTIKELDSAARSLRHSEMPASGTLRIGSTHVAVVLEPLLLFLDRYPSMTIKFEEITAAQLEKGVLHESFDVAIGHVPGKSRQLRSEQLFSESLVLMVSAEHPMAHRKRIRVVELHGQPLALLCRRFTTRQAVDRCFEAAGATPNVLAEFNSLRPIIELIRMRPIATILAESTVPPSPNLRKIPLVDPSSSRAIGLLWKRNKRYPATALAFASLLKSSSTKRVFELWQ